MKLCNKVNEFLENDPPPDFENIPVSLAEHIGTCQECQKLVSFFQNLAQDKKIQRLSEKEIGEFMNSFHKKVLTDSNKNSSSVDLKKTLNSFFSIKLGFAFAIVILLVMFGFSFLFRQPNSIKVKNAIELATIKGNATILSSENITKNDDLNSLKILPLNSLQTLTKEEQIIFASITKPVKVEYKNGSKVFLTGVGQMKVLKDGLNVESGKFNAKFRNLKGIMKVRVPCAVLAIRGTEIKFNIQPSISEILLVEGSADLIPNNEAGKTIQLKTGKRVSFKNSKWSYSLLPKKKVTILKPDENLKNKSIPIKIKDKIENGSQIDKNLQQESDLVEESVILNEEEVDDEVLEEESITGREGFGF